MYETYGEVANYYLTRAVSSQMSDPGKVVLPGCLPGHFVRALEQMI